MKRSRENIANFPTRTQPHRMSRGSRLMQVPDEILGAIAAHLDQESFMELRLTCRAVERRVRPLLHTRVIFVDLIDLGRQQHLGALESLIAKSGPGREWDRVVVRFHEKPSWHPWWRCTCCGPNPSPTASIPAAFRACGIGRLFLTIRADPSDDHHEPLPHFTGSANFPARIMPGHEFVRAVGGSVREVSVDLRYLDVDTATRRPHLRSFEPYPFESAGVWGLRDLVGLLAPHGAALRLGTLDARGTRLGEWIDRDMLPFEVRRDPLLIQDLPRILDFLFLSRADSRRPFVATDTEDEYAPLPGLDDPKALGVLAEHESPFRFKLDLPMGVAALGGVSDSLGLCKVFKVAHGIGIDLTCNHLVVDALGWHAKSSSITKADYKALMATLASDAPGSGTEPLAIGIDRFHVVHPVQELNAYDTSVHLLYRWGHVGPIATQLDYRAFLDESGKADFLKCIRLAFPRARVLYFQNLSEFDAVYLPYLQLGPAVEQLEAHVEVGFMCDTERLLGRLQAARVADNLIRNGAKSLKCVKIALVHMELDMNGDVSETTVSTRQWHLDHNGPAHLARHYGAAEGSIQPEEHGFDAPESPDPFMIQTPTRLYPNRPHPDLTLVPPVFFEEE